MCHAAVANSGEQRRRLLAADADSDGEGGGGGGGGGGAGRGEPAAVMATAAAPWQESGSRQAREMSAMVAALARVVAGSAAPPAKGRGGAGLLPQAQDASMADACWPYPYAELQPHVAEPSPPRFVLHGMSIAAAAAACMAYRSSSITQHTPRINTHVFFSFLFSCDNYRYASGTSL
jgi:hypothetical protein